MKEIKESCGLFGVLGAPAAGRRLPWQRLPNHLHQIAGGPKRPPFSCPDYLTGYSAGMTLLPIVANNVAQGRLVRTVEKLRRRGSRRRVGTHVENSVDAETETAARLHLRLGNTQIRQHEVGASKTRSLQKFANS